MATLRKSGKKPIVIPDVRIGDEDKIFSGFEAVLFAMQVIGGSGDDPDTWHMMVEYYKDNRDERCIISLSSDWDFVVLIEEVGDYLIATPQQRTYNGRRISH